MFPLTVVIRDLCASFQDIFKTRIVMSTTLLGNTADIALRSMGFVVVAIFGGEISSVHAVSNNLELTPDDYNVQSIHVLLYVLFMPRHVCWHLFVGGGDDKAAAAALVGNDDTGAELAVI